MDYGIEVVLVEEAGHGGAVAAVEFDEGDLAAGDASHAIDGAEFAVREVVGDDDVEARGNEFDGRVRADVSGAAGDQYTRLFHGIVAFCRINGQRYEKKWRVPTDVDVNFRLRVVP